MTKLNVLVSLITDANDYQREQAASAQSAAIQLGASVQIIYSGNDAVQQTQQILGFIQNSAKRPDAILAEPVGTGMAQIAGAAVAAGIAWAIINAEVDYVSRLRQLRAALPSPGFQYSVGPRRHRKDSGPADRRHPRRHRMRSLYRRSFGGCGKVAHQGHALDKTRKRRRENREGRLDPEEWTPRHQVLAIVEHVQATPHRYDRLPER